MISYVLSYRKSELHFAKKIYELLKLPWVENTTEFNLEIGGILRQLSQAKVIKNYKTKALECVNTVKQLNIESSKRGCFWTFLYRKGRPGTFKSRARTV